MKKERKDKTKKVVNKENKGPSVMVIVVGNGHGGTSSNPGRD